MFKSREMPQSQDEIFEIKKRKAVFQFIRKFPEAIKLYQEHGLLPKNEGWSNVARHCLVEAASADTIAEQLNFSDKDKHDLSQAALLHDFYKRRSIEMINEEKEKIMQGLEGNVTEADIESSNRTIEILRKSGISEDVIQILSNSLGYASIEEPNAEKLSLPEKILHYLDDITLNENIVSLRERIEMLKLRYPQINEEGVARYGKPTYDQQFEIGSKIERELANLLELERSEDLPEYIKEKLIERINKTELID